MLDDRARIWRRERGAFYDVTDADRPMRDISNDARPISVSLLVELETFAKPSQLEHVLEEMLRAVRLGVNNRARAYTPDHAGHFANNGYWREIEVELS